MPPTEAEFADYLIERCLQSQALATVQHIGYLRKNMQLALKQQLKQQLEQGRLQTFLLDGKIYYYRPQLALTNKLPNKVPNKVWLLSPFDNLVIQRDRLKQLFNFDYQIEVYVPAAKRQIGYYSLPILYKDQFIGQVDVKADRASNTLLLQHLVLDEQVRLTDALKVALTKAVVDYACFNGCESWQLIKASAKARDWLVS
nr:crosslink repair DNA glycosylase YcaQ family protein [Rheinheimera sp. KL1]